MVVEEEAEDLVEAEDVDNIVEEVEVSVVTEEEVHSVEEDRMDVVYSEVNEVDDKPVGMDEETVGIQRLRRMMSIHKPLPTTMRLIENINIWQHSSPRCLEADILQISKRRTH